jgi:hypothetical protein
MSAPSPIFAHLATMMQKASDRLAAIDTPDADDGAAGRTWSRQRNGLMETVLAEPPVTAADALIILAVLSEWRDLIGSEGDDMAARDRLALDEVTTIALANVNTCLCVRVSDQKHHTPDYRETMAWLDRQTERWLPRAEVIP